MSEAEAHEGEVPGRRGLAIASVQTFLGTVISRVALFGLAIATARLLGSTAYGEYAVVQSTALLLALGLGQPLAAVSNRYSAALWSRRAADAGRLASTLLSSGLVVSLLVAAGLFLAAPDMSQGLFNRPQLTPFLRLGGLAVVFQSFFLVAAATLRGFQSFKAAATVQAVQGVVGASLALVLVWRWGLWGGVMGLVALWATGCALAVLALGKLAGRLGLRFAFGLKLEDLRSVGGFYFPYLLSVLAVVFSHWCVRVILTHGPDAYRQVGLFSAAFQYAQVFQLIVTPLLLVSTPALTAAWSRSEEGRFRQSAEDLFRVLCVLLTPLAVAAVGCAPWLVGLLGADYGAALHVVEILFVALAVDGLLAAMGPVLIAMERGWLLMSLTFLRVGALLGLAVALLNRGALGAALAFAVSEGVLALALLALLWRLREHDVLRVVGRLCLYSLPGLSLGGVGLFLDTLPRAGVCVAAAVAVAYGLWLSLSTGDRTALKSLLRRPGS